jgi:hypothetical protein
MAACTGFVTKGMMRHHREIGIAAPLDRAIAMADAKQPCRVGRQPRFAGYCVKLARQTNDPEARSILREMAAEWLRLVDNADH